MVKARINCSLVCLWITPAVCYVCHYRAKSQAKRHDPPIIRPTIQHLSNNKVTSFLLMVQLNVCYVKLDSKCFNVLVFDTRESQKGGFKWIFSAVCMQGNSPCSPNRWGQESRAKGQHPQTLREDTETSKEEACCLWRITKTKVAALKTMKWPSKSSLGPYSTVKKSGLTIYMLIKQICHCLVANITFLTPRNISLT